jgi:hypothetical protein
MLFSHYLVLVDMKLLVFPLIYPLLKTFFTAKMMIVRKIFFPRVRIVHSYYSNMQTEAVTADVIIILEQLKLFWSIFTVALCPHL